MKTDIHPNYVDATIVCSCGHTVETRSTKETISVEICSNCHPFYTGKQKLMDTGGRLARFQAKLETTQGDDAPASKKKKANVRTFTPAVDPKVLAAKAARAEAKALEDAKRKKEEEEAEKVARAEAKAAKEAAAAEAAANPPAEESPADDAADAAADEALTEGEPREGDATRGEATTPVAAEAAEEATEGAAIPEPEASPVAEEAAEEAAAGEGL